MMENVSLYLAASAVIAFGSAHKSVVVRAATARLLDNAVAGALGAERFMGTSREFQVIIFSCREILENWRARVLRTSILFFIHFILVNNTIITPQS